MTGLASIAGAGLMGRLMALKLLFRGWEVRLLDPDSRAGHSSAAYTGAGMLAPCCELEGSEPLISQLGRESVSEWRGIVEQLKAPVALQAAGTLVVAHGRDARELERLRHRTGGCGEVVGEDRLRELEPELTTFRRGLYFAGEGHIDNRQLLAALERTLLSFPRLQWIRGKLEEDAGDLVVDCRGLGARPDDSELRGVRGEVIYVRAPDVRLNRPVRLMHPRYPLYVVPRAEHVFVIGATQIESDYLGGITVRSSLELLSALMSLHPGFAEAEVMETCVNCRPAYPDNLPRIRVSPGRVRINGLYRHGFLLGPRLAEIACRVIGGERIEALESRIVGDLP